MSSNLKVNTILPSAGTAIGIGTASGNIDVLGHIVGHNTPNISGINSVTASHFYGDGSNLTGITGTTINGNTNNYVVTATGTANTLQGESNLTFASNVLTLTGDINVSGEVQIAENIVHSGDGNTAIGFPANDTIRCLTAGTERLRINADGKIGISRTATQHPLEIGHASEPTVSLWRGSTKSAALQAQSAGTYLMSYENSPLFFSVASGSGYTERLRIASDGKIGIDENSPAGKLHIGGIGSGDIVAELTSGSPMFTYRNGSNTWYHAGKHPSDDTFVITQGANTTATELLRISSTGQLGVSHNLSGTSAYNRLMLHNPHDGSCWIQMTSTASGNAANTDGLAIGMNSSNIGHVWLRENAKMMFATNGTSRMEISAEGYISNSAQPMFGGHGFAGAGTQTQSQVPAFKFTTVTVNQGSHFDNSTGIFTCPVAGKYLVLACFAARANAYAWSGLYVLKNGSTMSDNWFPPAVNTTAAFAGSHFTYAPLYSGTVYNCAANDTLVMGYHSGYSAPANASRNSLFIMLVG